MNTQAAAVPTQSLWQRYWRGIRGSQSFRVFMDGIWNENPIFRQVLGICSALAVTNLVANTLVMCVAVIFVAAGSNVAYSLVRNITPVRTRMLVQMLIIASFVIVVHRFLQAYLFGIAEQIGAYVGLIITNCIILGRVEAFASKNRPLLSFMDGLGAATGYSLVLLTISIPREILGFGSVFGITMPWVTEESILWNIMVMAPAGFFGLGIVFWICRSLQLRQQKKK